MLKDGKIKNGVTLIALQWFFLEYFPLRASPLS